MLLLTWKGRELSCPPRKNALWWRKALVGQPGLRHNAHTTGRGLTMSDSASLEGESLATDLLLQHRLETGTGGYHRGP
jgi:hypothetical protein